MIYFIADTHFNHENIIKYCKRPYKNKIEMNEDIIKKWNESITENDIVYHLGDYALGTDKELELIAGKLNGKKFLIRGNHDTKGITTYEKLGFKVLKNAPFKLENEIIILSHVPIPDKSIPKGYVNIHGHIHNKPLHFINTKTNEMEYPPKLYSQQLHICVSVDAINFKPISLDKIYKIRELKEES